MRIAIDASNISGGGTATHLVNLLRSADPICHRFSEILVWAPEKTLSRLPSHPWLRKCPDPTLEQNFIRRGLWQRYELSNLVKENHCDILFVPGGPFATDYRPVVSMSQNLLPFSLHEVRRYGLSCATLKFLLLRKAQATSFRKADGVIFLTAHARNVIEKTTGELAGRVAVIPHGIDERFFFEPRPCRPLEEYSAIQPLKLIYVSTVDCYKHQWHVARAVANLRAAGYHLSLDLIGSAYPPALKRLKRTLRRIDSTGRFIRYLGSVPYDELHNSYAAADICVFASSCENLPITLLEGMAAGLPTVCSNHRPMSDILQDAAVFFNPEDPEDISNAIRKIANAFELRNEFSNRAYERAQRFSWKKCADQTFKFLLDVKLGFS